MSKKHTIMSLSIEPDLQEKLKRIAKEDGVSVSKLVRDTIQKYLVDKDQLTVVEKSDEYSNIVLQIPKSVQSDSAELRRWLEVRMNAIASKF